MMLMKKETMKKKTDKVKMMKKNKNQKKMEKMLKLLKNKKEVPLLKNQNVNNNDFKSFLPDFCIYSFYYISSYQITF